MEKVALFVDVQNIYYTVKERYNSHFNYGYFWKQATTGRKVVRAVAYAIDRGDPKQIKFQQILKNIGFDVKLKPFIQRGDGSTKGDWDVGITVDMLDFAEHVDVIVLASGDGDYDLVVDRMREKYGVSVEVYGVPELTAASLVESSSRYFPIDENFLLIIQ
ncbi:MAG: NYN domain-containing protein [Cyclobacteriaceae bacterium]|nr:NYN domain-containing protein [Cyclobacteriaceae bacterium]